MLHDTIAAVTDLRRGCSWFEDRPVYPWPLGLPAGLDIRFIMEPSSSVGTVVGNMKVRHAERLRRNQKLAASVPQIAHLKELGGDSR
jgi:hypothetical protein